MLNSSRKFTFSTIVFCSTLRIGPYLFYVEKFTTQFKATEKMIGHRSRFVGLKFENVQIWANNTQHVATWWSNAHNMLHPTTLQYVALEFCDRLPGANLTLKCFRRQK